MNNLASTDIKQDVHAKRCHLMYKIYHTTYFYDQTYTTIKQGIHAHHKRKILVCVANSRCNQVKLAKIWGHTNT